MRTMEHSTENTRRAALLRALLLPLEGSTLLVPSTAVAEVIESEPVIDAAGEDAPVWLVGTLAWRGLAVPLVRLEAAMDPAWGAGDAVSRVVVLNSLNGNRALPFVALALSGLPRLTQVGGGDVATIETAEAANGVLRWVQIGQSDAIIPDMDWLEKALVDHGAAAE